MKPTVLNQILYSLTIAAGVTLPPLAKASDPPSAQAAAPSTSPIPLDRLLEKKPT